MNALFATSRILIVEDDPSILRALHDNLSDRGCRVLSARDGEEGLTLALNGGPDLILLDVMLPGFNGFKVCEAVRREGLETPIIMLTARGQEEDVIRGLDLGADDYITKPFRMQELMARIHAMLRRSKRGVEATYAFGPFILDLNAHQLLRDGVPVALTAKEFRLLEFLLRNPGRALTRERIMNAVWGNALLVTTRSVDRCVTTLRSKIEEEPRNPAWIETIRDIGYRFTERLPDE